MNAMKKLEQGLTLIEVLVALAIIAIAMTAAIKAASLSVQGIGHLQEKTLAAFVANQAINEARVGIIIIPPSAPLKQVTHVLNKDLYWELSQKETPNPHIKEINVKVFANPDEDEEVDPLFELSSFIYFNNQTGQISNERKR